LTPLDVARRIIKAIKQTEKPSADGKRPRMRILIEYHEEDILKVGTLILGGIKSLFEIKLKYMILHLQPW